MKQTNENSNTVRNSSFKIGDKTNDPYLSPTPGHLPIVAWTPVPRDFQILLDCNDTDLCENPPGYEGCSDYDKLLNEIARSLKKSGFNTILMMGSYKGCEGMMEAALNTTDKTADEAIDENAYENADEPTDENGKPCDISSIFVVLPRYSYSFDAMNSMIEHFETNKLEGKPYPSAFLIQNQPQFNDWSQSVFGLQYKDTKDYVKDYEWNNFTVPCIYFKQWREKWLFFTNLGGSGVKYNATSKKWQLSEGPNGYRSLFSANANNQIQYLQAMQLLFHPGLWCYNQFPFVIEKNNCELAGLTFDNTTVAQNITANRNLRFLSIKSQEFYHFLECFKQQAEDTNRPFWSFIGTSATGSWNGESQIYENFIPTPTIGMLRFEAFNALALGAQGLVCWLYGMGLSKMFLNKDEDNAVFVDSPMQAILTNDPEEPDKQVPGKTKVSLYYSDNPLWQDVKTVMNEVRSLEKVFLNTKVLAFGHCFPGDNVPKHYLGLRTVSFASGTPAGFKPIQNVTFLNSEYPDPDPDKDPHPYPHPGVLISILKTVTNEDTVVPSEPIPVDESSTPSDAEIPLSGSQIQGIDLDTSVTNYYIVITNHDAFNLQRIQISFLPGYKIGTVFNNFIMDEEQPNPPVVPSEPIDNSVNVESQSVDSDGSSGVTKYFSLLPGSMQIYKFTRLP